MEYHGNFLDTEFKNSNFLKRFKVIKTKGIVPSTGVYELRIWNKDKLKKILNDFLEVGTSKYNRLKNQLIFKNRNLI